MIYTDYEPPKEDYFTGNFTQIYYNDYNVAFVDENGDYFTQTYNDVDENGFMVNHEPYNIYMANFTYELNLPSYPRSDIEVEAAMRLIACSCDYDSNSLPFFEALDDPNNFLMACHFTAFLHSNYQYIKDP